jgi:hypothetical protein
MQREGLRHNCLGFRALATHDFVIIQDLRELIGPLPIQHTAFIGVRLKLSSSLMLKLTTCGILRFSCMFTILEIHVSITLSSSLSNYFVHHYVTTRNA